MYLIPFMFVGAIASVGVIYFSVIKLRRAKKYTPFSELSLRQPGHSLAMQIEDLRFNYLYHLILACLVPLLPVYALVLEVNSANLALAFLAGLIEANSLFRIYKTFKRLAPMNLGYQGEVYTGQELNYLMRTGAYVFHDLPYQYGNIDHIIVSRGGVFTIETKTYRKSSGAKGQRNSKLIADKDQLYINGYSTAHPVRQAKVHRDYIAKALSERLGHAAPVTAVIALPGWFIERKSDLDYIVVNPKRGKALKRLVSQPKIEANEVDRIAMIIEDYCRTAEYSSSMLDADAHKKYDWGLNRRREEKRL